MTCVRLAVLALALALAAAHAPGSASAAPGVNLRWDACYADGGASNKMFACNTNTGSEALVASCVPGRTFVGTSGAEICLDIFASTATVPPWWQLKNAGTCRTTALSFSTIPPTGATQCVNVWQTGAGGIGAYNIGYQAPNRIRVNAAQAVGPTDVFTLPQGQETFLCRFVISHAKTVGTGSCSGCLTPMCVGFTGVKITSYDTDPEPTFECHTGGPECGSRYLRGPTNGAANDRVTWQGGSMPVFESYKPYPPESPFWGVREAQCDGLTPTIRPTWGAIKSLYR